MLSDFFSTEITREMVYRVRNDGGVHRICFATTHANQPKRSSGSFVEKFEIPFIDSVGPAFKDKLGLALLQSKYGGYWRSIKDEKEYNSIVEWKNSQGTRVFIRDCLDSSVALDFNLKDSKEEHTRLGEWESRCKLHPDTNSLNLIVQAMGETIRDLPGYRSAPMIAAVPPRLGKDYDLPSSIAGAIARQLNITDITKYFSFAAAKGAVKDADLSQKWNVWEQSGLSFQASVDEKPSVILIDDKYQSGISIQFVASKLRAAGFGEIYGLCVVKTLRDTDNR